MFTFYSYFWYLAAWLRAMLRFLVAGFGLGALAAIVVRRVLG